MVSVFVSYSHQDKSFAQMLSNDLEKCGVRVWLDERELRVGDSIIRELRNGIDQSDYFIVVISEASNSSEWVQRELDIATTTEIEKKKKKVLPILLSKAGLPAFLQGKLYADFRQSYQDGFTALRRVLAIDEQMASVMISILFRQKFNDGLIKHLRKRGYRKRKVWKPIEVCLEIAGGYFAHMRGDHNSRATEPSLFQPQATLPLREDLPVLYGKGTVIAFGLWRDEKFRDRGLIIHQSGSMVMLPEWRNILYVIGQANNVYETAKQILDYSELWSGERYDLDIALKWWNRPRFIPHASTITIFPE